MHRGRPNTEIHPCFSGNQREWGQRDADGLTWYLATHRSDFTFRTQIFKDFPTSRRLARGTTLEVGVPYRVVCEIGHTKAMYSVARLGDELVPYAECQLTPGAVPASGHFGFVTYDRTKACTIWDVHVTSSESVLPSLPTAFTVEAAEDGGCPICFHSYDPVSAASHVASHVEVLTPCDHAFCFECLARVCAGSVAPCPVCRAPIELAALRRVERRAEAAPPAPAAERRPERQQTRLRETCSRCRKPVSRRDPLEGVNTAKYCSCAGV